MAAEQQLTEFGGTSSAWTAPKLRKAVCDAKKAGYAHVVLDGTLIPVDRVAADWPFYSVRRPCR